MSLPVAPEGILCHKMYLLHQEVQGGDTGMLTPGGGYWDYKQNKKTDKTEAQMNKSAQSRFRAHCTSKKLKRASPLFCTCNLSNICHKYHIQPKKKKSFISHF